MSRAGGWRLALALALGLAVTGLTLVGAAQAAPLGGGPSTPIDVIPGVDDDVIQILCNASPTADEIAADSGAVDSASVVMVFSLPGVFDTTDASFLGSTQAANNGSFAAFPIGDNQQDPATGFVYIYAVDSLGIFSAPLALYNDIDGLGVDAPWSVGGELPLDLITLNQIYADGDSIVVTASFNDTVFAGSNIVTSIDPAASAIADFSQIDTGAGSDNVAFDSWGTDGIDNDGDWQDSDSLAALDPGDADGLSDDVGLDGVQGTLDDGEGDGQPTPGEYFCDVGGPNGVGAGNSQYDAGEPFTDVDGDRIHDDGEPDLDFTDNGTGSDDLGERGIYQVRWNIVEATSVTDEGQGNFNEIQNLPVVMTATDCCQNMTVMNGTDPENRFLLELDNLAPSVSELTDLEQESGFQTDSATDNELEQQIGSQCFVMGQFVDFTFETPSDNDVDYVVVQISVNGGAWQDMSYDPIGDANGDGYPGTVEVDDDRDGAADSSDFEVNAAITNSSNDGVDNDNDGAIDEESDGLDNDGAGGADDAGEEEAYDASADDNEDGIVDGVARINPLFVGGNNAAPPFNRAYNPQPHVLQVGGLGGTSDTWDWYDNSPIQYTKMGAQNLDVSYIRSLYTTSDTDSISLRAVAVDNAGGPAYGPTSDSNNFDDAPPGPLGDNLISVILADQTGFSADEAPANTYSGNSNSAYAVPFCMRPSDTEASASTLLDDLGDEICDAEENEQGGDPDSVGDETAQIPAVAADYTLSATASSDAAEVSFWISIGDSGDWRLLGTDVSGPPWTMTWVPGLVDNDPANRTNRYWLTTTSEDLGGNAEPLDRNDDGAVDTLDAQVDIVVTDCVAPIANITRVENGVGVIDDDLTDGAVVPISNAINIWVDDFSVPGYVGFSDRDEIQMFADGGDNEPGISGVDDDGDGTTDERDYGYDGAPGTADDEWGAAGSDDINSVGYASPAGGYWVPRAGLGLDRAPGNVTDNEDDDDDTDEPDYGDNELADGVDDEYFDGSPVPDDDYFTNDVIRVDFQYRSAGGGGPWLPIPGSSSLTGTIVNGNVSDLLAPLKITWDVTTLEPGDYDIRAQAFDIEGNTNDGTAFITTIHVDNAGGLRAYITPPVQELTDPAGVYNLYAHTYIHDNNVDHVEFQFSTDMGTTWAFIGVDDNDDASADPGGDILMRAGSTPFQSATDPDVVGGTGRAFPSDYDYWDADADGYSALDPIINDNNNNNTFDFGDMVIVGDANEIPANAPLTDLNANGAFDGGVDLYYVDTGGTVQFEPQDWVYQDNVGQSQGSTFDLWTVSWDARGLDGEVWVRAVATNELGVTDSDGIPYETLTIDVDAPCAEITGIALEDGTFQAPNYDSLDVFNNNDFIQVRATVADADVEQVEFQWSVDGGANWLTGNSYFDVNEDNDFYSDIDGTPGFSGGDEIFFDADGNFAYSAGDVVLLSQGVTDPLTPLGWQLIPLLGEDPSGSGDEDGDGQVDEDDSDATDLVASGGGFYDVFLNLVEATADGYFQTDTQVLFRAIASDAIGNSCPNPEFFKAIIHERGSCLVDAIVATTEDGDTLDVFNAVSDGDETDQIDGDVTTINVFATADAQSAITQLCLFYRKDPNSYPDLTIFNNPWVSAGACDATYPYNLAWDVAALEDGCYQFYVECTDATGTPSSPPENPYGIRKLTVTAEVTAFVNSVGDTLADGSSVLSGDELTVFAELSDPSATDNASVTFRYAERVAGESVGLSLTAPYVYSLALTAVLDGDPNAESTVTVTSNGVPLTYYTESDFDTLSSSAGDCFTIRSGGDQIEINGAPSASDTLLVSYNVTGYSDLANADDSAPFSVELGFLTGGIPGPSYSEVNAIDVIASVSYNYFTPVIPGEGACLFEPDLSEGHFLNLLDAEGPCATIFGLERDRNDESYPFDFNQPGNPMCLYGDKQETGLSAKEVDVFVVTDEPFEQIDSVYAFVDGEASQFNFTPYSQSDSDAGNDSLSLPITMYVQDYQCIAGLIVTRGDGIGAPVLDPADIQNVTLRYTDEYFKGAAKNGAAEAQSQVELTMYDDGVNGGDKVAGDGCYTASPRLGLGQTYAYWFDIDLVTGDYSTIPVADARNNNGDPFGVSAVVMPEEFWYFHFDQAVPGIDVLDNGVHSVIVWAVDEDGNRRSDKSCDGDVTQFLIDTIAPVVATTDVTPDVLNPNSEDCDAVRFSASIPSNPASIPALGVDMVQFQFSPDDGDRWFVLGTDESADDGWQISGTWSNLAGSLADPSDDGIDNDGDGWTDEDELVGDGVSEETANYFMRVCATDECGNSSLSDSIAFSVDTQPPDCEIVSPAQGSLFVYGDDISICAVSPDAGNLSRVLFQYMDRSGEWQDIDATPQDDSDDPGVPAPDANADSVCVTWDSSILDLDGENPFVWIRCCVTDMACNQACDNDPILVQFYDNTAPGAWLTTFNSGCGTVNVFDPQLAIQGDQVEVCGIAIDPSGVENIAQVTVERDNGGTWTELFTVFGPFDFVNATTGSWCTSFDATPYCGQTLTLRATATDVNGNTTDTQYNYSVRVDCAPPAIAYNADGFVFIDSTAVYLNDGTPGSSLVVVPNPFTGDVIFRVTTDDPDVQSMVVQFRENDQSSPGDWQNLQVCGDKLGDCPDLELDFAPSITVPGGGFFWWGVAPDWATNAPLPEGQYEFRVLASDYACNDNSLSTDFVAATVDTSDPFCTFFGNNAIGGGDGQVAAGDTVRLVITASDELTDVVAFWFEWSFDGSDWTTIGADKEPDADKIDTENPFWSSDILWTTPNFIVSDRDVIVRAHVIDAARNEATCDQTIRLEDVTPPSGTRPWDIALADGGCIQPPDVTPNTIVGGTTINSEVLITAQTAAGDSGVAQVTFELSNDGGVNWTTIGVAQDGEGALWTITFDPTQLNSNGNPAFPDGTYLLRAWAQDVEGNLEELTDTTPIRVPLTIDCTAPVVKMDEVGTPDFDATPQVCETVVERGPITSVSARTIVSIADMTETTDEDVIVTWYIANANDELNVSDAWKVMNPSNGFFFEPLNDEDNPDESRPYSFLWNTALTEPALVVGSSYAIVGVGEDLVCNVGDPVQAWQDGLGTCFTVTDTTASCATIVYLDRENEPVFQQWPAYSRVNRINDLTAAILSGDTDVQRVDFYYRAQGSTTWILADGDLSNPGGLFWTLNDWSSDNLTEGVYEFAANAIDDVGNADFDPSNASDSPCSITPLIIDRTAPVISNATAPVDSQTCADARYNYDNEGNPTMDVWVTLDSAYVATSGNDVSTESGVEFAWKYSSEPDADGNWDTDGFGSVLFDAPTGRFSTTFDVTQPEDDIVDFRVTMTDSAGNQTESIFATWVVLPTEGPSAAITSIVNLTTDTTLDDKTDITAGDPIRIWVTASTGSQYVPSWASCGLDSVFYEVARGFEKGDEPSDDEFMPLTVGTAVQDTLPGGNAFFADWNTTGLTPGFYWVRAYAVDCCGNRGDTQAVELRVKSIAMPKAAVVCFDADLINDVTGRTLIHVYAQEWCEQVVDKVIFQYRDLTPDSTDWIEFGFVESTSAESLWVADIGINTTTSFQVGDLIEFRAIAIKYADSDSSNEGAPVIDLIDTNPAVTQVTLQRGELSGYVFEPVRTSPELVNFVSVMLVPEAEGDNPQWRAEVRTGSNGVVPWANVVFDDVFTDQGNTEASFRMFRSIDDPTLWRGGADAFFSDLCIGGDLNFCAAALDTVTNRVDIDEWVNRAFRVTNATGTNGTVNLTRSIDDSTHSVMVNIPPGNDVNGALLVSPAVEPVVAAQGQQNLFLVPLQNSCWDLRLINCSVGDGLGQGCGVLDTSFPATVKIEYSDEDFPLDFPASEWESRLIPAHYDGNGFHVDEMVMVGVDTLANTVTFRTENLCDNNLYCLIIPSTDTFSFEAIPLCNGYVNDHPTIQGTLTDIFTPNDSDDEGGSDIELDNIRVSIDGQLVAWTEPIDSDNDDDQSCNDENDTFESSEGYAERAIGNGCFDVDGVGRDGSDMASAAVFKYVHSTLPEDALTPGEHVLRVTFPGQQDGEGTTFERRWVLNVDATPPRAWINGGFVSSPILENTAGYVDATEPALTAYLLDRQSGIMVKPRHADPILNVLFSNLIGLLEIEVDFPSIPGDPDVIIRINDIELPIQDVGLKMDVWLVDTSVPENDDFFDRDLIQTATADMLEYTPPLWSGAIDSAGFYTPSDTLKARFPLIANLAAYDGREIEVVLYTAKVTQIGPSLSDILDALGDFGDDDDDSSGDSLAKVNPAGTVKDDDEITRYLLGPTDCVGNVGSAYTAARFIVDATPPEVAFQSPVCGGIVPPGGPLVITFGVSDGSSVGSGIDEESIEIRIVGPDVDITLDNEDFTIADGVLTVDVEPEEGEAFPIGDYTITVTGEDGVGHEFTSVCNFMVASPVLSVLGGSVFPNPFDPATGDAIIRWDQSQPGFVTIQMYDFAGDFVGNALENRLITPGLARAGIPWGGTDQDGDDLADGGYVAHIIVKGGGRTQTTNVKIAIDRQD